MSNKILFYFGGDNSVPKPYRLGEMLEVLTASYYKGKELKYDDGDIWVEWSNIKYNIRKGEKYDVFPPKNNHLPMNCIKYKDIDLDDYSKVINFSKPNSLYDDCPVYSEINKIESRKSYIFINYLNKYYLEHSVRPIINLPKNKSNKFKILIGYRSLCYGDWRNSDDDWVLSLNAMIRSKFDGIEINLTGDIYNSKKIEILTQKFDNIYYPTIRDIFKFIYIVNNSDLVISPAGGIVDIALFTGIPVITVPGMKLNNGDGYGSYAYWNNLPNKYGDNVYFFFGKENLLNFECDEPVDYDKLIEFIRGVYEKKIENESL